MIEIWNVLNAFDTLSGLLKINECSVHVLKVVCNPLARLSHVYPQVINKEPLDKSVDICAFFLMLQRLTGTILCTYF